MLQLSVGEPHILELRRQVSLQHPPGDVHVAAPRPVGIIGHPWLRRRTRDRHHVAEARGQPQLEVRTHALITHRMQQVASRSGVRLGSRGSPRLPPCFGCRRREALSETRQQGRVRTAGLRPGLGQGLGNGRGEERTHHRLRVLEDAALDQLLHQRHVGIVERQVRRRLGGKRRRAQRKQQGNQRESG